MTSLKTLLTFLLLTTGLFKLCGQNPYGTLVLKMKQDNNKLWYNSTLSSKDTTINLYQDYYKTRKTHDSIPLATYKLTLTSELGDQIERSVTIEKRTKEVFKLRSYYRDDTASLCFMDRMTNNDTLRIFIREGGCWHAFDLSCSVTKHDSQFYFHVVTSKGNQSYLLSQNEYELLRTTELNGRLQIQNKTRPPYLTTTQTRYYYSLNQNMVSFYFHRPNILSEIYNNCKQRAEDQNSQ